MSKHTEGEVHAKHIGFGGILDKILLLDEDESLVATFDILDEVDKVNAYRFFALWNAANGMSTERAVALLEKGEDMVGFIAKYIRYEGEFDSDLLSEAQALVASLKEVE